VDGEDRPLGTAEKVAAHRAGELHRAFSVFVFDSTGRLLLQRRARGKYHSGGRWTNTCCGHPRAQEPVAVAARRRLREEMGFACDLGPAGAFTYRADVGQGLVEHEYDHVLVGRYDHDPTPDPREVEAWRWVEPEVLRAELAHAPQRFSVWFAQALEIATR
jgi:isopentenyl-diphosphate delta-isomerase